MEPDPEKVGLWGGLEISDFIDQIKNQVSQKNGMLLTAQKNGNYYSIRALCEGEPFPRKQIIEHIKVLEKVRLCNPKPSLIPEYYGFFELNQTYYLIFEYLKSDFFTCLKGLTDQAESKHFSNFWQNSNLERLFCPLFEGLLFLHHHQIFHLNFHNNNIYWDDHSQLKIIDYGLIQDLEKLKLLMPSQKVIHYMAPEVLENIRRGGEISTLDPFKSDVFTLGMILMTIEGIYRQEGMGEDELEIMIREKLKAVATEDKGFPAKAAGLELFLPILGLILPNMLKFKPENRYSMASIFKIYKAKLEKKMGLNGLPFSTSQLFQSFEKELMMREEKEKINKLVSAEKCRHSSENQARKKNISPLIKKNSDKKNQNSDDKSGLKNENSPKKVMDHNEMIAVEKFKKEDFAVLKLAFAPDKVEVLGIKNEDSLLLKKAQEQKNPITEARLEIKKEESSLLKKDSDQQNQGNREKCDLFEIKTENSRKLQLDERKDCVKEANEEQKGNHGEKANLGDERKELAKQTSPHMKEHKALPQMMAHRDKAHSPQKVSNEPYEEDSEYHVFDHWKLPDLKLFQEIEDFPKQIFSYKRVVLGWEEFIIRELVEDQPFSKEMILRHISIMNEIWKISHINHLFPHIYGYIRRKDHYYLIFRSLKSTFRDLMQLKKRKDHLYSLCEFTFSSLLEAMVLLKTMDIGHFFFHPENVWVTTDSYFEFKIMDVGLITSPSDFSLIREKNMNFATDYLAPEVLQGRPFDPFRAGIYSLAMIVLETTSFKMDGMNMDNILITIDQISEEFLKMVRKKDECHLLELITEALGLSLDIEPEKRPCVLEIFTEYDILKMGKGYQSGKVSEDISLGILNFLEKKVAIFQRDHPVPQQTFFVEDHKFCKRLTQWKLDKLEKEKEELINKDIIHEHKFFYF